jgi:hypothetical protein
MDFAPILSIVIVIAALAVVLMLVKRVFAVLGIFFLLSIVLTVVCGYFVMQDFSNFEAHSASPMLFVLKSNSSVLAAFQTANDSSATFFTDAKMKVMQEDIQKKQYKAALGDGYKMFIIDVIVFDDIQTKQYEVGSDAFSKESMYWILESEDALQTYVDVLIAMGKVAQVNRQDALNEAQAKFKSSAQLKGTLFAILMKDAMADEVFLYRQLNRGKIEAYPKTAMFTAIKYVPLSILDNVLTKMKSKTGV